MGSDGERAAAAKEDVGMYKAERRALGEGHRMRGWPHPVLGSWRASLRRWASIYRPDYAVIMLNDPLASHPAAVRRARQWRGSTGDRRNL